MVIRWPGHIQPGTIKDQMFAAPDWVPTLVDIAGGPKGDGLKKEIEAGKYPGILKTTLDGFDAGSTVPKGKSFAHLARHARHNARRERGFETEPERDRRCKNFSHPTSHGGLLPPRCGTMIPSLLRTQPMHGRFRAFHGI
jgi:arylsulfatase A-like enzyme